jgi:hypothetical protein
MEGNADEAAYRQHRSNRSLVPASLRQQEHSDIRTQAAPDISQKEIQPIELDEVSTSHCHDF